MGRKLRSMFKPVTPRPGSGERPSAPSGVPPLIGGIPAGSVADSQHASGGVEEAKGESSRDTVAKLAYERWLETGGGAVENWVWAEAEYKRRGG